MYLLTFAALVAASYLVGAIPNGVTIGRIFGKNPLEVGSGKTGATNTMRAAGPVAAGIVLLLDMAKGAVAVFGTRLVSWPGDVWLGLAVGCAGAAAIVGHNWSVWVRLTTGKWGGGRGIMTAVGAVLGVSFWIVLAAVAAGGLALLLTRYVVLGVAVGALAGLAVIIALSVTGGLSLWLLPGTAVWCLLVVLGFHDNIGRLISGSETRLGSRQTHSR